MKHNQPNKTYEVAELLQYLSGNMSREEMYAIERAALDDEMLADAIEGYIAMRKTMTDDAIIALVQPTAAIGKQTTAYEQTQTPVVKINWIKRISYAAAAILIAGTGWWMLNDRFINDKTSNDSIAAVESTEILPESMDVQKTDGTVGAETIGLDTIENEVNSIAANKSKNPDNQQPAKRNEPATPPPSVASADVNTAKGTLADDQLLQIQAQEQMAAMQRQKASRSAAPTEMMDRAKIKMPAITIMAPADTALAIPKLGWSNLKSKIQQSTLNSDTLHSLTAEWIVNEAGNIEQVTIKNQTNRAKEQTLLQLLKQTEPWKLQQNKPVKVVLKME